MLEELIILIMMEIVILTETREKPMGDIYHSQLVVVGAPSAETAFTNFNKEAYFRKQKDMMHGKIL